MDAKESTHIVLNSDTSITKTCDANVSKKAAHFMMFQWPSDTVFFINS